jgi:hypothetical protein
MSERHQGSGLRPLLVFGLLLVFFLQGFSTLGLKSPTFDEPAHIGAGFSYLKTHEFKVNLQHPPLLKEIGALPLLLIGARWPMSPDAWAEITDDPDPWVQWQLGMDVIFGNDSGRVLFWTRLPFLLLATLLGFLIYAWGRRLAGETAAIGALFLYAFDPTILAHGTLVTTDVGFAAFLMLFLFALYRYLEQRSLSRLLLCGLALGAALASKFSGVILLPITAVLVYAAARFIPAWPGLRPSTLADPYASADTGQRIVWCLYALLAMGAVAALVIYALYFFPANPFLYFKGMGRVNADHLTTYVPFMAGRFKPRFWSYYVVAYLLKEPVASILLAGVGLMAFTRRGVRPALDRAFVLLPPAFLFLGYTVVSHNLGFRYVIPALPFLHLLGGFGLAHLVHERGPGRRLLATVLCAWVAVAACGIYPDHLSYFNELACLPEAPGKIGFDGGSACGPLWFDDSNVDWGQGLGQLKEWLDRHAPGRVVNLGYFGSIRPEFYGLVYNRIAVKDLAAGPPAPGLYAVSAHLVARGIGDLARRYGRGEGNWLLHRPPTAVVAHAYYIYDIPRPPE